MQGMLLWLGHSEVSSSRCDSLPSTDGASLVAIQAALAMRAVEPSIQPAAYVQPDTSALYNLSRPSPGSCSESYSSRMPSLFGESSQVSFLKCPDLLQIAGFLLNLIPEIIVT